MRRRRFLSWSATTVGAIVGIGATATDANAISTSRSAGVEDSRLTTALAWPNLVNESQLPVGQSTTFTFGAGSRFAGQRGVVYRQSATTFKVFDLICTHHGCTVVPVGAVGQCPCHHSTFSLQTGAALSGPAQLPLTACKVKLVKGVVRWIAD
jgi:Rieske Fe-S protein